MERLTSPTNERRHFNSPIAAFFLRSFLPFCLFYTGSVYDARLSIRCFLHMTSLVQSLRTRNAWCSAYPFLFTIDSQSVLFFLV